MSGPWYVDQAVTWSLYTGTTRQGRSYTAGARCCNLHAYSRLQRWCTLPKHQRQQRSSLHLTHGVSSHRLCKPTIAIKVKKTPVRPQTWFHFRWPSQRARPIKPMLTDSTPIGLDRRLPNRWMEIPPIFHPACEQGKLNLMRTASCNDACNTLPAAKIPTPVRCVNVPLCCCCPDENRLKHRLHQRSSFNHCWSEKKIKTRRHASTSSLL